MTKIDFNKPVRFKKEEYRSYAFEVLGNSSMFMAGLVTYPTGIPSMFMWTEYGEAWQADKRMESWDIENVPTKKLVVTFTEVADNRLAGPGEYMYQKNTVADWFESRQPHTAKMVGPGKVFVRTDREVEE